MEKAIYKKMVLLGHGGVKCPCCRPNGCHTTKEARVICNRVVRRKLKLEISKEMPKVCDHEWKFESYEENTVVESCSRCKITREIEL